uniref:Glycosyltransferase family 28 N-terminal domain-containing protein n=1 Tax=Mucochytrium quahogii TaxID=96639 RepID=A0A7S2REG2_9STRA|mmetsp:Transcript_7798/g.12616  ORF Transcript_7798/g.12616 Transcript_7798/m.12616 type:complete len:652 (+) Transcript_7798:267-2222(+)
MSQAEEQGGISVEQDGESARGGDEVVQGSPRKHVLIIVVGSRGDLNPFLALGEELQDAGYHVRLATHETFKAIVERFGFEFCKLAGSPSELMGLMGSSESIYSPSYIYRNYHKYRGFVKNLLEDVWNNCVLTTQPDMPISLIIANPISICGVHVAEYLDVPVVMMFTMPWTKSREHPFPMYLTSGGSEPSSLNITSYGVFENAMWFTIKDLVNDFREQNLKLETLSLNCTEYASSNVSVRGRKVPYVYCWSRSVIPKPSDWGDHIMISGYCMTKDDRKAFKETSGPKDETPPPGFATSDALDRFLSKAKEKDPLGPLYIGFGSIFNDTESIRKLAALITRSLHLLACTPGADGYPGVVGTRCVVLQAVNHLDIFTEEFKNTDNMCTQEHKNGIFEADEPVLVTTLSSRDIKCDREKQTPQRSQSVSESAPSQKIEKDARFAAWARPGNVEVPEELAKKAWEVLQDQTIIIQEAKHSTLFPQCSFVVHHGGAGTFMTAVHAGIPQLVVPFFGDQFIWGDIVKARGIGTCLSSEYLNTTRFVKRVEHCLMPQVQKEAKMLGVTLRREVCSPESTGTRKIIRAVEEWQQHNEDHFDNDIARCDPQCILEPDKVEPESTPTNPTPMASTLTAIKSEPPMKEKGREGCSGSDCVLQ